MSGYFVLWWLRQRSTCGMSNTTPPLWERIYPRMGRCRVSGGHLGFVEIKRKP